ncbi:hypothetical protein MMC10_007251 [Thelotrema lepadinum]|nr:hypothetical protein [Thelotrema lepadinum]
MSRTDFNKRKEILNELVYYVFDSILIPLLRSNFYITESNTDKNRLFFFRHDVWKKLTEPHLSHLKLSMFQEIKLGKPGKSPDMSGLNFSHMRLVPKGASFRPIMNLRRRTLLMRKGKMVLTRAINTQLKPAYGMLNFEKTQQPGRLGASMFSVGEIHPKLRAFRSVLQAKEDTTLPLYFAKVDVKSCFDTIPQNEVMQVIERICARDEYQYSRHVEIQACDPHGYYGEAVSATRKPSRKFLTSAYGSDNKQPFVKLVDSILGQDKRNAVFVESGSKVVEKREKLMRMLLEHVRYNKVKIGKKYYCQKRGIPQGSIVSSILCNLFYGDFEKNCLGLLGDQDCLLMRLIDDFLLITTSRRKAVQFLQTMHNGNERYGITIRPEKTLTNFSCKVNGFDIASTEDRAEFPYCGTMINTASLGIIKDRDRAKQNGNRYGFA